MRKSRSVWTHFKASNALFCHDTSSVSTVVNWSEGGGDKDLCISSGGRYQYQVAWPPAWALGWPHQTWPDGLLHQKGGQFDNSPQTVSRAWSPSLLKPPHTRSTRPSSRRLRHFLFFSLGRVDSVAGFDSSGGSSVRESFQVHQKHFANNFHQWHQTSGTSGSLQTLGYYSEHPLATEQMLPQWWPFWM